MSFPEKPKGQILQFEPRNKPEEPPVEPIFDRPALPEHGAVVVEIEDVKDERYREHHRKLVKKIKDAAEATTDGDNRVEMAMRERLIQMASKESDFDKSRIAENFDTKMITDRALADMEEDEYVRMRKANPEDARRALEAAYAKAKGKYEHLYPTARPTMFPPPIPQYDPPASNPDLSQPPTPESPKLPQSWPQFLNWLKKFF